MMDDFRTTIEHLALIEPFSKILSVKFLINWYLCFIYLLVCEYFCDDDMKY